MNNGERFGALVHVVKWKNGIQWVLEDSWKPIAVVFRLVYLGVLKPVYVLSRLFIWAPMESFGKALLKLVLLPFNTFLRVFLRISLKDLIATADVKGTLAITELCIQYIVTTAVIGSFLGVACGVTLGSMHRVIKVPTLYVTVLPTYWAKAASAVEEVKGAVAWLTDVFFRSIPLLSLEETAEDNDNIFADLLDTYEYQHAGLRSQRADSYGNLTPISIPENEDVNSSELSGLSNMWDSVPETGTVRTDIEDYKHVSNQKRKAQTSGYYYDKFDTRELNHRKS